VAPEDALLNACLNLAIDHQLGGLGLRPLPNLALIRETWMVLVSSSSGCTCDFIKVTPPWDTGWGRMEVTS
jgi:hypothetical protein